MNKIHSFADAHSWVGKIEKEHVILCVAYAAGAVFHIEIILSLAYLTAVVLTFCARKV